MTRCLRRCPIRLTLLLLALPGLALAQTRTATFSASPDHATLDNGVPRLTNYTLEVTPQGGTVLPAIDLGKPTPVSGSISASPAGLQTLSPGTYTAVVFAVGPGGRTGSAASSPFSVATPAPRAAGQPTIQ